jgi:phosphoinositide-3-kinase regulatory subunit 4
MGNTVGAQPKWTPSTTSEYLAELREEGAPVPRRLLWSGRFVKTLECVSGASLSGSPSCEAIARVYLKRDTRTEHSELQRSLSLTSRARSRLLAHSSSDPPHTLPAQRVADCPRAVYLLRQKTHQTLASRIGSRPFPSTSEKRWLAYQLLRAVQQAHSCGIAHGDIKAENCALTSWSWLLLIDFATHKPAFLPRDNPSEFSFFFDTGSRRRCYVAPERFLSSDSDAWFQETSDSSSASTSEEQPSGPVRIQPTTFAADVFSAGCVIAELFLNGVALFDLSSLLTYSAEHHSESLELVDQIDEPDCRELVRSMIALNPEMRPSAYECLQTQLGRLFPRFFETELHPLMGRALQMSPNERIASFLDRHLSLCRYMCADKGWYHHVNQFLVDTTANVHMIEQVLKSDSALALPCGHWQWYRPKNVNDTSSGDQRSKSSMSNGVAMMAALYCDISM